MCYKNVTVKVLYERQPPPIAIHGIGIWRLVYSAELYWLEFYFQLSLTKAHCDCNLFIQRVTTPRARLSSFSRFPHINSTIPITLHWSTLARAAVMNPKLHKCLPLVKAVELFYYPNIPQPGNDFQRISQSVAITFAKLQSPSGIHPLANQSSSQSRW